LPASIKYLEERTVGHFDRRRLHPPRRAGIHRELLVVMVLWWVTTVVRRERPWLAMIINLIILLAALALGALFDSASIRGVI